MDQASRKAESERRAFSEFAAAAGLQVVPGSVQSRPPPEPDILCELSLSYADPTYDFVGRYVYGRIAHKF